MMTKEHLIDTYGTVRYTIGSGCSGGSLTQQQVANAYPGLYQGITPACSFTDAWSSAMQYVDYQLLRRYFENPRGWAPGVAWDADRDQRGRGPPEPGQRGHLHRRRSRRAATRAASARACRPSRSTTRRRTRRACAARCRTTWSTSSGAGRQDGFASRPGRQRRRRVRAQGARRRARSRPRSSST